MSAEPDVNTDPPDLQVIAKAIASEVLTKENLEKFGGTAQDLIANLLKYVFAGLTVALSEIVGPMVEGIVEGERIAEGSYQRMAAKVLSGLFNVKIDAADIGVFGNADAAAQKLGDAVLHGMGTPHLPLEPSDENAKKFIAMMGNLAVEGWLNGVIFEIAAEAETAGFIKPEKFAELKDVLISAFGLSRLSRRVFGPYVNTVVVTPFQWTVNKTYRPELLAPSLAARQYWRGRLNQGQVNEELARQGWSDDRIEAYLSAARKTLSIADVLYLARRGRFTRDFVTTYLRELGYDDETIDYESRLEDLRVTRGLLEAQWSAAAEAFREGHLDRAGLLEVASVVWPDDNERGLVLHVEELKKLAKAKRLSKGDIEDAVKRNIRSMIDYRRWCEAEGYDEESAVTMELLLSSEIGGIEAADRLRRQKESERADAAAKKAADDAARRAKLEAAQTTTEVDLTDIKKAVVRGLLPIARYTAALAARKYVPADVAFLTDMLQQDVDTAVAEQATRDAAAREALTKKLSLTDVERAVLAGILTPTEYEQQLRAAGFDADATAVLGSLIRKKLADAMEAAKTRAAAEAALTNRGVSLSQAETAVQRGLWTIEQYGTWLSGQGFNDGAVAVIVAIQQGKLDDAAAAAARKAAIDAELSQRGISLAQLESAVLRGIEPMAAYTAKLLALNYSVEDRATLAALLQAKLDEAIDAANARKAATPTKQPKGLSLAQLERAVVLGIVTFDAYRAELEARNYDAAAVQVLTDTVVRELQHTQATSRASAQAAATPSPTGVDLVTLETDVLAGRAPLSDYVVELNARGLSDDKIASLLDWLTQRLTLETDGGELEAAVDETVKPKDMNVGEWRDAVRDGLRSLSDFGAWLAGQGYRPAAVQILVQLVARQIERAAPKVA